MLKILSYSYDEDIKPISSGNTNQDIFFGSGGGGGIKVLCMDKGV